MKPGRLGYEILTGMLLAKGIGLLAVFFAPLILTGHHGHTTTVGWVLEVIEWVVLAMWQIGRGWRGRG